MRLLFRPNKGYECESKVVAILAALTKAGRLLVAGTSLSLGLGYNDGY